MKTINKYFRIIILLLVAFQINSCTEDANPTPDDPSQTTGQAMFWTASNLGLGAITVSCNGSTKTFNSYFTSGAPSCGATGAANFTLNPGTYAYSASAGSVTWNGNITVTAGGCSKMQLTYSGTGGSGSGTGGTTTGQAMFWIASDLGLGAITVSCNGSTKTFNSYYTSGAPSCGATGAANFTLNPGTYAYSASAGSVTWNGNITVTTGGCSKLQLTYSGTGGGGSGTGGTTTGQAMFWIASDLGLGAITVSCNGSTKTFNSYYTSGAPSCGATGAANFTLNPGTYAYSASAGSVTWNGNITVTTGGCSKLQLTYSGTGGGSGGGGVGTPGTSQVLLNQCVSGSDGDKKIFTINVPANVKTMVIETSEVVSCDRNSADLFVRRGSNPIVTKTPSYSWTADCASIKPNRERESCTFNNPTSGQWYVMLFGYNTYFISNLKVTVTY